MKTRAYFVSFIDNETEFDIPNSEHIVFLQENEIEDYCSDCEVNWASLEGNSISAGFCEMEPEEIARKIVKQQHWHHYHLPNDYDESDVESDLFHMFDKWVDLDYCLELLPWVRKIMNERAAKRASVCGLTALASAYSAAAAQ